MRYALFLLLSGFSFAGSAQVQLYTLSLTDSTKNIFYFGVDNTLKINWKGLHPAAHTVSISDDAVDMNKKNDSIYIVRLRKTGDSICHIIIRNKKGKTVLKKSYTFRELPWCELTLGGVKSNEKTSRSQVLNNPLLRFDCGSSLYSYNMQVISFTLGIDINDSVFFEPGTGKRLTNKQMELISKADDNSTLTIDTIRVLRPDGRTFLTPSIVIYFKREDEK